MIMVLQDCKHNRPWEESFVQKHKDDKPSKVDPGACTPVMRITPIRHVPVLLLEMCPLIYPHSACTIVDIPVLKTCTYNGENTIHCKS